MVKVSMSDLTVVFHGLGVFLANVPRHWPSDADTWPGTDTFMPRYMTSPMFAYAMALRAWLREEPVPPKWSKHLKGGVRSETKQALRFLQASRAV